MERSVCIFKEWFKPIFSLFLTGLLHKLKCLIPMADCAIDGGMASLKFMSLRKLKYLNMIVKLKNPVIWIKLYGISKLENGKITNNDINNIKKKTLCLYTICYNLARVPFRTLTPNL